MQPEGQSRGCGGSVARSYLRVCQPIFCLLIGVSCIRVSSDPTVTPSQMEPAETPLTAMATPANSEEPTEAVIAVASSIAPATPTPEGGATIAFATDSALEPIPLSLRWRFEAAGPVTTMDMISLDGGPLPDITIGTQSGALYTLGLDQQEYWRSSLDGPVDVMAAVDLDGDGIGEVATGNKRRLTLLEGGNVRWQYEASSGIASILVSNQVAPGQATMWLGTSDGTLIGLDADGQSAWPDEVRVDNGAIVQMIPARLGTTSAATILAGTVSGFLGAVSPEGSLLWQVDLEDQIFQLVVADLQGDSLPEIAVGSERGLVILDHTGEILSRWFGGDEIRALTAVELDRQGRWGLVVAVESQPGQVAALDGSSLQWQLAITDTPVTYLGSFDLDGDGLEEIVAGDSGGAVVLVDGEGGIRGRTDVEGAIAEVRPLTVESRLFAPGVFMVIRAGSSIYLYEVGQSQHSPPLASGSSPSPAASTALPPPPSGTLPRYELDVELDTVAHTVKVEEIVSLVNGSAQAWDELVFNVSTAFWPGVFTLHQTTLLEPGPPNDVSNTLEQTVLRVALPIPLEPGERVSLSIDYSLRLPRLDPVAWGPAGNAGWGPNLVQLGDWYPALVPFEEGAGWQTWLFAPVGDPVTSELANFDVSIAAPSGTTIAAAGFVTSEGGISRYQVEQARAFGLVASSDFARFDAAASAVPIQLYVSSAEQADAQIVLQTATQAVTLFEELYGAFPYPELVLAENGFLTSNEYSGFISLGGYLFDVYDGRADSLLVAITAHEVAHQWWYGSVGNDQVQEPWLDEGMAMLSELFYYERYYPELVDTWWQFRVDRWQPSGPVGASIYDFNDSASFVHNVYGQAAHFLQQLRETMGEQPFRMFLREYYRQNAGRLVTTESFFSLAQVYADADLTSIRALYFGR